MQRYRQEFLDALADLLGREGCLTDAAARAVYARDASHLTLGRPLAVALPANVEEVAAVLRLCQAQRIPFVVRGAGTGLSGGAVPQEAALVLSLARLDDLGPVEPANGTVTAGAGVVNERVSRKLAPLGLQFAPDPSSQSAATIGGNVAENAGGPHCLRVGVTLHHVARLDWLDPTGQAWSTGRGLAAERGMDLTSLLVGSEGCLGVVTAADLRLCPVPAAVATLLAVFPQLESATRAVMALMGGGILPGAVEMVDRAMLEVVEQAFHFGFPTDAEAALIVDLEGVREAVDEDAALAATLMQEVGARDVRRARDEAERRELWQCRKKAFGAVGRLAPAYISMDVVVPLGRLPDMVRAIEHLRAEHGVQIATALHAGDGNVHPGVLFDDRDAESMARAHRVANAILMQALALGGSVSGEHGIGIEKLHVLRLQLDRNTAGLMRGIKRLCDPSGLCNPGKALVLDPSSCPEPPPVPGTVEFAWDSLTVTAPAETGLAELQAAALARGLWIPVGGLRAPETGPGPGLGTAPTVGELIDRLLPGPSLFGTGTARDFLLELWAETGDGRPFHAGAPVFKNVAGYDLVHLPCGAGALLMKIQGATFQLRPAPSHAALWHFRSDKDVPDASALAALLEELAGWEMDLTAPVCIVDAFEVGARGVAVLAAGRDRAWDLTRKGETIARWAAAAGLAPSGQEIVPFTRAGELLEHPDLPGWVRRSGEWTFLARTPGSRGWPSFLTRERAIWQGSPPLLWVPLARCEAGPGWHADTLYRAGQATPPPAPGPGVPPWLLVGLKELFDPKGWLGEPDWFERMREELT
jgi:glycolate oxidase subunit GlcD